MFVRTSRWHIADISTANPMIASVMELLMEAGAESVSRFNIVGNPYGGQYMFVSRWKDEDTYRAQWNEHVAHSRTWQDFQIGMAEKAGAQLQEIILLDEDLAGTSKQPSASASAQPAAEPAPQPVPEKVEPTA